MEMIANTAMPVMTLVTLAKELMTRYNHLG